MGCWDVGRLGGWRRVRFLVAQKPRNAEIEPTNRRTRVERYELSGALMVSLYSDLSYEKKINESEGLTGDPILGVYCGSCIGSSVPYSQ